MRILVLVCVCVVCVASGSVKLSQLINPGLKNNNNK